MHLMAEHRGGPPPALPLGLIPPAAAVAGLVVAEPAIASLLRADAAVLLPAARFPVLVVLIVTGVLLARRTRIVTTDGAPR